MTTLTINTVYNFSLHANSVLGTNHKGARLLSILDYKTALKFANIVLLCKQIYPYLPVGSLADQTKYTYYLFEVKGKQVVLADLWIVPSSVEIALNSSVTLKLLGVSTTEVSVIQDQLRLLGIAFEIS